MIEVSDAWLQQKVKQAKGELPFVDCERGSNCQLGNQGMNQK